MEDNNQNNQVQQTTQEPAQDPRLIQPEIIGELRKEKIGKPILVIELFLLFGIVFASLPFINSQLNDDNSFLYKLLHGQGFGGTVVTTTKQSITGEEYLDGTKLNLLQNDSKLKFKNFVIKDIQINNNTIGITIFALSSTVNLNESEYYLEVTSSSGNLIIALKLTGVIDNVEQSITLDAGKTTFNNTLSYQGRIVEMKENDYPDAGLTKDELGNAALVCKKNNRLLTYSFKNDYLVMINDEDSVKSSNKDYLNLLDDARKKATSLGTEVASVVEEGNGFKYKATIDLSGDYSIPTDVKDYDYYPANTLAKKIKYAQKGKGYDCE